MATVYSQRLNTPQAPAGAFAAAAPASPYPNSFPGQNTSLPPVGMPIPANFNAPQGADFSPMYYWNQLNPGQPFPANASPFIPPNPATATATPAASTNTGSSGSGPIAGSVTPDMPAFQDPAGAQADYVWGVLKGIISGQDVPFTPKVIDTQKGQAKLASETGFNQSKNEIQAQQAASGYASSPAAASQLVAARAAASDQYGKASAGIDVAAAQQNFSARMSALAGAQQWIDGLRSFVATMTGNWWQRQTAMEQIALAQDRLNQEMELAWAQFGMGSINSPMPTVPSGA